MSAVGVRGSRREWGRVLLALACVLTCAEQLVPSRASSSASVTSTSPHRASLSSSPPSSPSSIPLRIPSQPTVPLLRSPLRAASPQPLTAFGLVDGNCTAPFYVRDPSHPSFPSTWVQYNSWSYLYLDTFYCPSGCLLYAAGARVWGRFPYHANSSICLSAVHAGLLNDSRGGVVFVSRFYPHDWSNSSTQTVFPHGSAHGSVSNGVLSLPVPPEWHSIPAPEYSYSWTLRGRGAIVTQRRVAPFPPRSGHLHVFPTYHIETKLLVREFPPFELIVGGHNATAYLNDVWLRVEQEWNPWMDRQHLANATQWRRLPDAPFSPRADMVSFWTSAQWWRGVVGQRPTDFGPANLTLWVVGGQTGHHCGLRELGECSGEGWQLRMEQSEGGWQFNWTAQPHSVLPYKPRCGAVGVEATLDYTWIYPGSVGWGQNAFFGLVGGQLSYADERCRAPPETVNDVCLYPYRSNDTRLWNCTVGPFSPRRSMQREDAFALAWAEDEGRLQPPFAFTGGLRYIALTSDPVTTRPALDSLELYSDAWACWIVPINTSIPASESPFTCEWGWHDRSDPLKPLPSGTLPIALAGAPPSYSAYQAHHSLAEVANIGGFTSKEAALAWTSLLPDLNREGDGPLHSPLPVNTSILVRPLMFPKDNGLWKEPSSVDILTAQRGLPLNFTMQYAELHDPDGAYQRGTSWLICQFEPANNSPQMVSAHRQLMAYADEPEQSTSFLWQAASSANTTRPLFNFELRRLGAGRGQQAEIAGDGDFLWTREKGSPPSISLSGGRSGERYMSDLVTLHQGYCIEPMDPSFEALLGPVVYAADNKPVFLAHAFVAGDRVRLQCAEQHGWMPTNSEETALTFTCAPNLLWVDVDLRSPRKCVRSSLNCTAPFRDDGGADCAPPLPVITALIHSQSRNVDNLTMVDFQVSEVSAAEYAPLEILGHFFREPLDVLVGGQPCSSDVEYGQDAVSTCMTTTNGTQRCYLFASRISCAVPLLFGINLPVYITVGPERVPASQVQLATISSAVPTLRGIVWYNDSEPACTEDPASPDLLHWVECPLMRNFTLIVQVWEWSLRSTADVQRSVWLDQEQLRCDWYPNAGCSHYPDGQPVFHVRCAKCDVHPRPVTSAALTVQARYNNRITLVSESSARLGFQPCRAGTYTNHAGLYNASAAVNGPVCLPCSPGYRSDENASACQPCIPGTFAASNGSSECALCPASTFSGQKGADRCEPCPINSWGLIPGRTQCDTCTADQYITLPSSQPSAGVGNDSTPDTNPCVSCPSGAQCRSNGNLTALPGAYVLLGSAGRIQTVPCPFQACVSASSPAAASELATVPHMVPGTGLRINNNCGRGRYPSLSVQGLQDLPDSDGLNLLCAACIPGYSEVNGRCIECGGVQWAKLLAVLCVALLLVYVVYRLPHDWTGNATLSVLSYFLQQSMVFLSSESMPQLLTLLNMSLLGDSSVQGRTLSGGGGGDGQVEVEVPERLYLGTCIVPLTDVGRLVMQLLSPLVALAMLALIAAVQLGFRWRLQQRVQRAEAATPSMVIGANTSSRPAAFRWYDRLFCISRDSCFLLPPAMGLPVRDDIVSKEVGSSGALSLDSAQHVRVCYLRSLMRLVQLSYTSMSQVALSFLAFQPVPPYTTRLMAFPTIDIESNAYFSLLPVICLVIVVVLCGLPLALLVLLKRAHDDGLVHRVKTQPLDEAESTRSHLVLQWTAMYQARYWWMAPFSLVRRLFLVLVLVLVGDSSAWVWVTLVNYLLLALHLALQPFERRLDNHLEAMTLLSLSMQSTLLSAYPPPFLSPVLFAALLLLVALPLLAIAVASVHLARERARRRRQTAAEEESDGFGKPLLDDRNISEHSA